MNHFQIRKGRFIAAVCTILAASTLSGCGSTSESQSESGETYTLTLIDYQYEDESSSELQQALDACSASEGITIERESVPSDQFVQTVLLSASSDDMADVLLIDHPDLPQIAETGALASLDDVGVDYSSISANVLEMGSYEGVQYGVAPGVNTLALFYNKDIFEEAGLEPPTTWDELRDVASQLTTDDRYGLAFSANSGEEAVFQFQSFLFSNGGTMSDLDSEEAVEALEFVTSLVNDGSASASVVNWSQSDVNDQFIAGQAAMQINGSWQISILEEEDSLDWGVVSIPAPEGKTSVTPLGGEIWVVSQSGAENPAAQQFVQCMIGEEAMTIWTETHNYVPTNETLAADYISDNPNMETFVTAVETAQNRLLGIESGYADASTNLSTAIQEAVTGSATPEEALAAAAADEE